jgi:XRE family transcriptional regulator, aerobic/anaerobic benzoate catabolism transcriptional regulator
MHMASDTAWLAELGELVRALRREKGLSLAALADRASLSERFLSDVEFGKGNISITRLRDLAQALGLSAGELLLRAEQSRREAPSTIALLGLRGAGKSTVGALIAEALAVPFVELDALVAERAGMSLATLFEIHGEAYFRRLERETLRTLFERARPCVLATGGALVRDAETYTLLRAHARTIWLRAKPEEHWERVVAQGDGRPMRGRANARAELAALLRDREPLYARAEKHLDTSRMSAKSVAAEALRWVQGSLP